MTDTPEIDAQTIALIAERVIAALRGELEAIAMSLLTDDGSQPLTVGDVAERFGVARSTVYAHWREWGGYKLGESVKAPIRFEGSGLPRAVSARQSTDQEPTRGPKRRRGRRELISDAPRFDHPVEDLP